MKNNVEITFPQNRFALWTDTPPLKELATGAHGVARNILQATEGEIALALTHKFRRRIRPAEIREASRGVPVFLYADCAGWGIRRISKSVADLVDLVLFAFSLPWISAALRRGKATRILALMGADGFQLWHTLLLLLIGLPIDIYLVDDLEESARKNRRFLLAKFLGRLQPFCLKKCAQVYTICPGFSDHLRLKYAIPSKPLYLTQPSPPAPWHPYVLPNDQRRRITFIGALNHLYNSSLLELYNLILEWNLSHPDTLLSLQIITYSNFNNFLQQIKDTSFLEIHQNLPESQMQEMLKNSFACFLPYSFLPDDEIMVTTSFSCKILEYFTSGRPMIVYGPAYASLPRYFREENLDFSATTQHELANIFESLLRSDSSSLTESYHRVWTENHSPHAFRSTLGIDK